MEFTIEKFNEVKRQAEVFYKTIGEVHCPYFQDKVTFNAKGLEHLKFQSKNHARSQADQYTRLKLIHLAPEVVKLSRTIQGMSHGNNFEYIRSNARTEFVIKNVSYYEFIAILEDRQENKRVRVVVKQIENGPKYFWSIIPFWKMDKENRKRKMNSGNLETD
ncbi:MAG: hypothetical protein AAB415_02755 [Patescibacteria group bacterium]